MINLEEQLAVLDEMERLLSVPEKWGQNAYGVNTTGDDDFGMDTSCWDEQIGRVCLLGAEATAAWRKGYTQAPSAHYDDVLIHVEHQPFADALRRAVAEAKQREFSEFTDNSIVVDYNDDEGRTHEEILAVVRRAKEILKEGAAT